MPPMSTVLLPTKCPVRPPPPAVVGDDDEAVLPLGFRLGGTPPPFAVVVLPDAWLVLGTAAPLPCAVGVTAELLEAATGDVPPSLVTAVPVVVLDDVATACRSGVVVPTTAATTPTTATTAAADQTFRRANNGWL